MHPWWQHDKTSVQKQKKEQKRRIISEDSHHQTTRKAAEIIILFQVYQYLFFVNLKIYKYMCSHIGI